MVIGLTSFVNLGLISTLGLPLVKATKLLNVLVLGDFVLCVDMLMTWSMLKNMVKYIKYLP